MRFNVPSHAQYKVTWKGRIIVQMREKKNDSKSDFGMKKKTNDR